MKPPILSERQFEDWCKAHQKQVWDRFEAQRDADAAYYEPLIDQAKAEVAREIEESLRSALIASNCGARCRSNNCKMYYSPSKPLCPALEGIIKDSLKSKYTGGKK